MYLLGCRWHPYKPMTRILYVEEKNAWKRDFGSLFHWNSPSVGSCLVFPSVAECTFPNVAECISEASGAFHSFNTHSRCAFPLSSDRKLTEGKTTLILFIVSVQHLQKQCRVRSCCKLQGHTWYKLDRDGIRVTLQMLPRGPTTNTADYSTAEITATSNRSAEITQR